MQGLLSPLVKMKETLPTASEQHDLQMITHTHRDEPRSDGRNDST